MRVLAARIGAAKGARCEKYNDVRLRPPDTWRGRNLTGMTREDYFGLSCARTSPPGYLALCTLT